MLTAEKLRSQTSKDLAQMAKKKGVQGWHSMRKEQLVKALLKLAKKKAEKKTAANGRATNGRAENGRAGNGRAVKNGTAKTAKVAKNGRISAKAKPAGNPRLAQQIRRERMKLESMKSLSNGKNQPPEKDRIILIVRDSYWVQAYWEITSASIRRAKVAMGPHWHNAKPILRVTESASDESNNTVDQIVREIQIHGGVNNWFIEVPEPPKTYRVAIGYLGDNGRFHMIAKSHEVSTPVPGANESFDLSWADIESNYEKVYSQSSSATGPEESSDLRDVFEEKLRRPMTTSLFAQFTGPNGQIVNNLDFSVDVEMVVYGKATPGSSISLAGEPVRTDSDGTFAIRMPMPDRKGDSDCGRQSRWLSATHNGFGNRAEHQRNGTCQRRTRRSRMTPMTR